jgi:hypothetical protein
VVVDLDVPLRAVADVGADDVAEVAAESWRMTISRIEYWSPMGTSGLGMLVV